MKNLVMFLILVLFASLSRAQGPAYPYRTDLSFTPSTGVVSGYNMYRATQTLNVCGTYSKINTTVFTGASYSDLNPPQGSYCYAATAVSSQGESGFSTPATGIQIPAPPPTGLGAAVSMVNKSATFHWAQSNGSGLKFNQLWKSTKAGGPYNLFWTSATPVTTVKLTGLPTGASYFVVTATAKQGVSGKSNQAVARIN